MSKDLAPIFDAIRRFLWRYHLTMFIVFAVSAIAVAIFSLLSVIAQSSDTKGYAAPDNAGFDQETIKKVKALNDQPNYTFSLPTNKRTNPFTE